ncbi:adenylosuccinate lyase [Pedobacter sp. SD-b]|uniref:Adenylosuccinate lyase n=1 Tax=Pedobacter segetis TaxID=2793069 RepID=A0ABS1BGY4_9SPHI|nr:adenylosuccinate lyase [Pedobacter segetis]MBK0381626.1 adenylosuccinate lyase [Pedobacter segetis]
MNDASLNAISPIDGRYHKQTENLSHYFSEAALIKFRVFVEMEYFLALSELPIPALNGLKKYNLEAIKSEIINLSQDDVLKIKEIEKVTNHDVKAVEYFIKEKFDQLKLSQYKEYIHFGLTSQDINNTAIPYSFKAGMMVVYYPQLQELIHTLKDLAKEWDHVSMLAHTHGQPASPTRLGKEITVFIERIENQVELLKAIPYGAKFGGATGNFNAHHVAFPLINWKNFGNDFVNNRLKLKRLQNTTQIEHYDYLAAQFDGIKRINTIILDLNRDFWTYISMNYFKQKIKDGEVGSSAMPHKVNPIDFENSEGNIGIANALLEHLSAKLPVSRLQRDLTDSTVLRNIGVPLAHTIISLKSTIKGLNKLLLNQAEIQKDLDNNWAVVAEAIQTILRRENYPNPYEALKDLTRTNTQINADTMASFIDGLAIKDDVKKELKAINPSNYTGI